MRINGPSFLAISLLLLFAACSSKPKVELEIDKMKMVPYYYEGLSVRNQLLKASVTHPKWVAGDRLVDPDVMEKFPIYYVFAKAYHTSLFSDKEAVDNVIHGLDDYVKEAGALAPEEFGDVAIDLLYSSLGPYNYFRSKRMKSNYSIGNRRAFAVLGATLHDEEKGLRVLALREDGIAAQNGIRLNDLIVKIQGEDLSGLSDRRRMKSLLGFFEQDVALDILREGRKYQFILPVGNLVLPEKLTYQSEGNKAVIHLLEFTENSADQVRDVALLLKDKMQKRGYDAKQQGFVIDLRGNPGGLLNEAVLLSDYFLTDGEILTLTHRYGTRRFEADKKQIIADSPLVILMDGGSASASEVFAGALAGHGRAKLVGLRSYGKIHAQSYLESSSGEVAVLTTETYYLPFGKSSEGGIIPHIVVGNDFDQDGDEQLQAAYEALDEMIASNTALSPAF